MVRFFRHGSILPRLKLGSLREEACAGRYVRKIPARLLQQTLMSEQARVQRFWYGWKM
jgi:hypothetical protein